jgi:hypothetical protein
MSHNGLPGSRDEAYRAGMQPMTLLLFVSGMIYSGMIYLGMIYLGMT